jgi:hypothetical protein
MGVSPAPVNATYSFKDLSGVLRNPSLGSPIQLSGGFLGSDSISIRNLTTRTELLTAADGTVMPSYVPGDSAEIIISVQQTSALHHALIALFNALKVAADNGDVSGWANTSISLRTLADGSFHNLIGVGFDKIADKPYQAHGQNVTWTLRASFASQS